MAKRPLPSPEVLRQLLHYEPETGKLFWKPRDISLFEGKYRQRAHAIFAARFEGKEALTADNGYGYKQGRIFDKLHMAHRVIWALVHGEWPSQDVDHINGNRSDNRAENLRAVSRTENMRNARRPNHNTSGHIGVRWQPNAGKWRARIKVDRRTIHVGYFDSLDAAVAARKEAEAVYGFHQNHGRD